MSTLFPIGPNHSKDLRSLRPYFVVTLEDYSQQHAAQRNEPRRMRNCDDGIQPTAISSPRWKEQRQAILDYVCANTDEAARPLLAPGDLLKQSEFIQILKKAAGEVLNSQPAPPNDSFVDEAAVFLCRALPWNTLLLLANINPQNALRQTLGTIVGALNELISELELFSFQAVKDSNGNEIDWPAAFNDLLRVNTNLEPILRRELREVFLPDQPVTVETLREKLSSPKGGEVLTGRARLILNRLALQILFPGFFASLERKGPVTDIFVISHGWHRNFFTAVAAYDQIISRFSLLMRRRRLTVEPPFQPLFLALHWNSDPTEDGWVDGQGRRDKMSFLQRAEMVFDRPPSTEEEILDPENRFLNVFEDIFQFFSRLSAPDTDALSVRSALESSVLAEKLYRFSLRDAPGATEAEKTCVAWTCFFRSEAKGFLSAQEEKPAFYLSAWQAAKNLAFFVIGLIGLGIVVGPLGKGLTGLVKKIAHDKWYIEALIYVLALLTTALLGYLYLLSRSRDSQKKPKRLVPWTLVAAWFPLQVLMALPWLFCLFVSYLIPKRKDIIDPPSLFPERMGRRNEDITADAHRSFLPEMQGDVRYKLAENARKAVSLFRSTLDKKNNGNALVTAIDNQMAFWGMQIRGTQAGATAAEMLSDLLERDAEKNPCMGAAKIHFLGHSFGGLVILNALRHVVLDARLKDNLAKAKLQSVCLLEAAVASSWFAKEERIVESVRGTIGCVFSAYDTANGFFYPVANNGRYAAGFVGLCNDVGGRTYRPVPDDRASEAGLLSSLVASPDLLTAITPDLDAVVQATRKAEEDGKSADEIARAGREAALASIMAQEQPKGNPFVLNLDASRIIYAGSKALGGGHDDIFKDDVTNLCWAITQLNLPTVPEAQPVSAVMPFAATKS